MDLTSPRGSGTGRRGIGHWKAIGRLLSLALAAPVVSGQCPQWKPGFQAPGLGGGVSALVLHDAGAGTQLYAGGGQLYAPGVQNAQRLVAWDGTAWSGIDTPAYLGIVVLHSHDDGTGRQLYAGGSFFQGQLNGIARWDGTTWTGVGGGMNGPVEAMATWDDGSGPALYAAGEFTFAGGVSASRIAKWDGTSWSALGLGLNAHAYSLGVFDDGSGSALYAGGEFSGAGLVGAARIAKWDGVAWSSLGLGLNHVVKTMVSWDDGSGPALYCGGWFYTANGSIDARGVARWNGASWSALSGSLGAGQPRVEELAVYDDGSGAGPQLYAGGQIVGGIARHSPGGWSTVGAGLGWVTTLAAFDDGSGRALYAGGSFASSGSVHTEGIARWYGNGWQPLTTGAGIASNFVEELEVWDDGMGEALYAGGSIFWAGQTPVSGVARWNGQAWAPLGSGVIGSVMALTDFDDGSGSALYAGGSFTQAGGAPASRIARWDGSSWSALGSGVALPGSYPSVHALAVFDDGSGPALYAGGLFSQAGGVLVSNIARWDGTSWSTLGLGTNDFVIALAVFDDGSGPALYAGGEFTQAGGAPANRIARWDGSTWSALGTGVAGSYQPYVAALHVFDDGSGPALYAAGDFDAAGGASAQGIARWNGSAWSALGSGLFYSVRSLATFDDGTGNGPALYAGGHFYNVGGSGYHHMARWDGSAWSALGAGIGEPLSTVGAVAVYDDGTSAGPSLYAVGAFNTAGGVPSRNIAAWTGCGQTGRLVCFGDGSGTACPCGNASAIGDRDGCVNSTGLGGRLRASGRASLAHDTLVLDGSQMTTGTALYFQGTARVNGGAGAVFGDGLRCAGGSVVRLAIVSNPGGASHVPRATDPPVSTMGLLAAPGTRVYQVWFRDAQSWCTSATYDLTNAVEIVWGN